MERLRELVSEKKKNSGTEKFSEAGLYQSILVANSFPDPNRPLITEEMADGEIERSVNKNIEDAFREVGSDCINYQETLKRERFLKVGISIEVASIIVIFGGEAMLDLYAPYLKGVPSTPGILVFSVELARLLYLDHKYYGGDDVFIATSKEKVVEELLALSLPQEYVDKHFKKIVRAFSKREHRLRKLEEKLEEEENNRKKAIETEENVRKARARLGLVNSDEDKSLALGDLIKDQDQNKE